jgi:hypothetical protein
VIHYTLVCESEHKFDGWFRNAEAFDEQNGRGIVTCPVCSSSSVAKALMAPSVSRASSDKVAVSVGHPQQARLRELLKALRDKVTAEADYVGDRFADEARKIHFGEVDPHGIYGEASREDVASLLEDGIDVMPLPQLPDERN